MADDPIEAPGEKPRREPLLNLPAPVSLSLLIIGGIWVATYFLQVWVGATEIVDHIYENGAFIPWRYGAEGEGGLLLLTTPVTYSLLHGGWDHLLFNSIWLAIFGTPVAKRIGTVGFICFWLVTSAVSAFVFLLFNWGTVAYLVGASGVISALTGASIRFVWGRGVSFQRVPLLGLREVLSNRSALTFTGVWLAGNVVLAAFSGPGQQAIAWEAHLGGFISGFALMPLFDRLFRV